MPYPGGPQNMEDPRDPPLAMVLMSSESGSVIWHCPMNSDNATGRSFSANGAAPFRFVSLLRFMGRDAFSSTTNALAVNGCSNGWVSEVVRLCPLWNIGAIEWDVAAFFPLTL